VRELEALRRELALFPDDAAVWRTAPGVTNSVGTLALHLAGNLKYFVGAVLGGTGYVRDRDAEFNRRDVPRAALDRELAEAIAVVRETLARIPAATLTAPYPVAVQKVQVTTDLWLLHLAAHLAFHLGQAGYLRRIVTADNRSAGPVPVQGLLGD
jgi:uncharacterized damage-inducible protein DinB